MGAGFKLFDDVTSEVMLDSTKIAYGLIAAGYMTQYTTWSRWQLASPQLDPTDPGNYNQTAPTDIVWAFSVVGCITPMAFVHWPGVFVGSSRDGNVTTFFYILGSATSRVYVYDTMRQGATAGMKCYADDAANTLTFNSAQVPLNIVAMVPAPLPGYTGYPGDPNPYTPYAGASVDWYRTLGSGAVYRAFRYNHPVNVGSTAVNMTFRRTMAGGKQDQSTPPDPINAWAYQNYLGYSEGCYGGANQITFLACDAPRTQMILNSLALVNRFLVPTDRLPVAIVIAIDNLPFPFSAF